MNLLTYGRSVTLAIQTMRGTDEDFDDWWRPYQEKMAADPWMRYFNTTRVEIVHEGALTTSVDMVIGRHGPVDMGALGRAIRQAAPPNTVRAFIGEGRTGASGWEVLMPDGSTEKVYFDIPDTVDIMTTLRLPDPPTEHDGKTIEDTSAVALGRLYFYSLRRIIEEFEARFDEAL